MNKETNGICILKNKNDLSQIFPLLCLEKYKVSPFLLLYRCEFNSGIACFRSEEASCLKLKTCLNFICFQEYIST